MPTSTADPARRRLLKASLGAGLAVALPACSGNGSGLPHASDVAQLDRTSVAGIIRAPAARASPVAAPAFGRLQRAKPAHPGSQAAVAALQVL